MNLGKYKIWAQGRVILFYMLEGELDFFCMCEEGVVILFWVADADHIFTSPPHQY